MDPEKGEIIYEFIECLINLHNGVGKETKLHNFHKNVKALERNTGSMTKMMMLQTEL